MASQAASANRPGFPPAAVTEIARAGVVHFSLLWLLDCKSKCFLFQSAFSVYSYRLRLFMVSSSFFICEFVNMLKKMNGDSPSLPRALFTSRRMMLLVVANRDKTAVLYLTMFLDLNFSYSAEVTQVNHGCCAF